MYDYRDNMYIKCWMFATRRIKEKKSLLHGGSGMQKHLHKGNQKKKHILQPDHKQEVSWSFWSPLRPAIILDFVHNL